jgi:hypothetical protein
MKSPIRSIAKTLSLSKVNRMEVQGATYDESQHQAALISWANDTALLQTDEMKRRSLLWLHSIPNAGGHRRHFTKQSGVVMPSLEAVQLKAEGLKKGVTDLRLDYVIRDPSGFIVTPGLVAEMKRPDNSLTPEQRDYMEFMKDQGFATFVWTEWQRGAIDIAGYMNLSDIATIFIEEAGHMRTFRKFSLDLLQLVGI